ncbi:MAG: hypothetical protein Q7U02_00980, partial [Desulfosalsimonadaceae bacterium]|nr:hypothetical protein [Desulfosalsimonadaceae bacterium]
MTESKFKHILNPIKIGPIELKNRIVLAPMNEALCQGNGEVGEPYIAYFGARAKGGTGLITTGAIMGTRLAGEFPAGRNPFLYHQGHMHGLGDLTDRVHYFGSKIAAQMTIGFGRQGHSYDHHKLAPAATAGLPYEIAAEKTPNHLADLYSVMEYARLYMTGQMTREMSIEEIHSEQKEFAN